MLSELLHLKNQYPNAKIVVGNTEIGVEVKFKHLSYPVLIQPTLVKEMRTITEYSEVMNIGASVTLIELENCLKNQIDRKPEYRTRIFSEIVSMLHWFAGKQVRNVAAVGGNIMTGSPISDLNPIFMAAGIKLNVSSLKNGSRLIPMDYNFFIYFSLNFNFTKWNYFNC